MHTQKITSSTAVLKGNKLYSKNSIANIGFWLRLYMKNFRFKDFISIFCYATRTWLFNLLYELQLDTIVRFQQVAKCITKSST